MSVEPLDDLPVRQMRAVTVVIFVCIAAYAIWQLVSGAGLGWLLVLLAYGAIAFQITASASRESAIYGVALWLGVGAALLGLADGLGYLHIEGGFNHWIDTALGAGAAAISASRLFRHWRATRTVD